MPAKVAKMGGKYRVVEANTGHLVKRDGRAVDGGGKSSKAAAQKQATAINLHNRKRGK